MKKKHDKSLFWTTEEVYNVTDQEWSVLRISVAAAPFCVGLYPVWLAAGMVVVLLFWLLMRQRKSVLGIPCCMTGAAFAMLPVWLAGSGLWAVDSTGAWRGVVKCLLLPLFWLCFIQLNPRQREAIRQDIPLSGSIMVILNLILAMVPKMQPYVLVNGRMAGGFQYPNTFAVYLLVGLIQLQKRKGPETGAICAVLWAGLILTGSRTAVALSGIWLLYLAVRRQIPARAWLAVGAAVAAAGVWMLLSGRTEQLLRFAVMPWNSSTFLGRLLYWKDAASIILSHPLGLGYGGYYYLQGSFQTGVYSTRYVHNEFLQLLLDFGWFPTGLVCTALLREWRKCRGVCRQSMTVLLVHSLFDFDFQFAVMWLVLVSLMESPYEEKCVSSEQSGRVIPRSIVLVLAFTALYFGTVDGLISFGRVEAALTLYPWDTQAQLVQLTKARTAEELDLTADAVLSHNKACALAYDAKARAAYGMGDCEAMTEYQLRALQSNPYDFEEYLASFDRLWDYMLAYQQQNSAGGVSYCVAHILELPGLLRQVEQNTSALAWRLADQPIVEFPTEYQQKINLLTTFSQQIKEK